MYKLCKVLFFEIILLHTERMMLPRTPLICSWCSIMKSLINRHADFSRFGSLMRRGQIPNQWRMRSVVITIHILFLCYLLKFRCLVYDQHQMPVAMDMLAACKHGVYSFSQLLNMLIQSQLYTSRRPTDLHSHSQLQQHPTLMELTFYKLY